MVTVETPLLAGAVRGDGAYILNPPNLHPWAGKGSEHCLGSWPRSLAPISSCGPEFDVEGSDAQCLASLGYILGSQHGSIWRGLISVSLHVHPTSYTAGGFLAWKIGDMDKSVDEGCKGVAHTKYIFFSHLRAKADDLFFLLFFPPARCHFFTSSPDSYHWKELSLEILRDLKKFYLEPLIS